MGFSHILGQQQALDILQSAVRHQHISHGYLFAGPEGVGKKMTALALAQYLNCNHPDTQRAESCGHCPSCLKMAQLEHPDVFIVEPTGASIKIEQIRLLNSKAALRSYEGRYQVVIIDDAHLMTTEAANSLLKTLEEPMPETVFILVSAQPQQLPTTILSRCQQLSFKPLPLPVLEGILREAHPELDVRINLAAALSRGSASQALALLTSDELSKARDELYTLLADLTKRSAGELVLWCEQWDKDRKMVRVLLELSQLWYRDLLIYCTTSSSGLLVNQDQLAVFAAKRYPLAALTAITSLAQDGLAQLERNASPRLVLEVCLLKSRALLGA